MHKFLCGYHVFVSLGLVPGAELPGLMIILCTNFLRKHKTVDHSSCSLLRSHESCLRVPASAHVTFLTKNNYS